MKNKEPNWENLLSEAELFSSAEAVVNSVTTGEISKSEGIIYLNWLCLSYLNNYGQKDEKRSRGCLILFEAQIAFLEEKTQELRLLCVKIQRMWTAVPDVIVCKIYTLSGLNLLKNGYFAEAYIVLKEAEKISLSL